MGRGGFRYPANLGGRVGDVLELRFFSPVPKLGIRGHLGSVVGFALTGAISQ
jgi:hypothetical protein